MRVFVQVEGAERFPVKAVRSKEELRDILDFARIGSQGGAPRRVYRLQQTTGRPMLIARYEDGRSRSSKAMRARRSPLWGLVERAAIAGLRKAILG